MHGKIVAATLTGHFAASFAALGMPPFYHRLVESLGSHAVFLPGWLFVAPTAAAALSNPWWGSLADRYGKKNLLLRAHLGLALSFWLTSFSQNVWQFGAALILQGLLGGTFAASNAYLATVVSGQNLTRLLTLMQGSARAALFLGPAVIGLMPPQADLLVCYRYLAVLPLLSAFLVWKLPDDRRAACESIAAPQTPLNLVSHQNAPVSPLQLYLLQSCFICATVVTLPYFVPFSEQTLIDAPAAAHGLLFGIPHFAYLLAAFPLSRWLGRSRLLETLLISQAVVLLALLAQANATHIEAMALWRLLMGFAITAAYIALHGLAADIINAGNAGKRFGALEGSTKWGAVAAGVAAGIAADRLGPAAPFYLGAGLLAVANLMIGALFVHRNRESFEQPKHLPK